MKIQVLSDIHFTKAEEITAIPQFIETVCAPSDVLVIAGDIGTAKTRDTVLAAFRKFEGVIFKKLVYVYGNHDFWCDHNVMFIDNVKQIFTKPGCFAPKPSLEDNHVTQVEDVAFICTPLWTPITNSSFIEKRMNDYSLIKDFTPAGATSLFYDNVAWLQRTIRNIRRVSADIKKIVIVTHTVPSGLLMDHNYVGDPLNEAFIVLDPEITKDFSALKADLWIHGHSHNFIDKTIDQTRYVRNPVGYTSSTYKEVTNFKPKFIIDL